MSRTADIPPPAAADDDLGFAGAGGGVLGTVSTTAAALPLQVEPAADGGYRYSSVRQRWRLIENGLQVADVVALAIAAFVAYWVRFDTVAMPTETMMFTGSAIVLTLLALQMNKAYTESRLRDVSQHINALFFGMIVAVALVLTVGLAVNFLRDASRAWLATAFLGGAVLIGLNHIGASLVVGRLRAQGRMRERIALIGVTERSEHILRRLDAAKLDYEVVGVFDDRSTRIPHAVHGHGVQGTTDDLMALARRRPLDRIIVTLPWTAQDRITQLLGKMRQTPVRLDLMPATLVWDARHPGLDRVAGVPVFTVANVSVQDQMGLLKRIEDLVLASAILLVLSPLMLLVALAVKLESRGPAIYRQDRYGFNNQVFQIFKFRSMRVGEVPDTGAKQATRDDPRITRVGRFIRRTSIDELPQLLNVLKGDMSIVGPRPHAVPHNELYGEIIDLYSARHNVRPGITGWAQVNGLRGETDTDEKMRRRVDSDLYYIENWSVMLDIKILVMTALRVWRQTTAY